MNNKILSVRVDEKTKKEFEKVCQKNMMTMSDCVNVFMKDVLKNQKFPFELSIENFKSDNEKEKN